MTEPIDPAAGDEEKTYEYIARQIEREDHLYQTRMTTCVAVNLGLGAAVASQISSEPTPILYALIAGCCVIGYLITRGIRFAAKAGSSQNAYLRKCFGQLNDTWPKRFPYPFYHEQEPVSVFAKFTAITAVFQAIWIGTFLFVTLAYFYSVMAGE
jgi:hypothetical protein